jgi:hypothetical protein
MTMKSHNPLPTKTDALKLTLIKKKLMFLKQPCTILILIFMLASFPLLIYFGGHDSVFQTMRLEGVGMGLSQGIFPVKIYPSFANGYGYAVGVFYGDGAFYLPALLELMGVSAIDSFRWFMAGINLVTVWTSWFCFREVFQSKKLGLLGCGLYTLSIYRLIDCYTRAAVGEVLAMMFLPLVFYGLYSIFTNSSQKTWKKHVFYTAIGLAGIVTSHVISAELTVISILLLCLLCCKRLSKPYVFLSLFTSAVLTIVLCLGFLVPFLDYYREPFYINTQGYLKGDFQNNGIYLDQLFSLFTSYGNSPTINRMPGEGTFTLGICLGMGLLFFLILLLFCYGEEKKQTRFYPTLFLFVMCCLSLFMCTNAFPWNAIMSWHNFFRTVIASFEFPWRLLTISTILAVYITCYALSRIRQYLPQSSMQIVGGVFAVLWMINLQWYMWDTVIPLSLNSQNMTADANDLSNTYDDYLPLGTNREKLRTEEWTSAPGMEITEYSKTGTLIKCHVTVPIEDINDLAGNYLEVPLLNYKYYVCQDGSTKEQFSISSGGNNRIRVTFPVGYEGSVEIKFQEPLLWRISEVLSGLCFLTLLSSYLSTKRKIHKFLTF